MGSFSSVTQSCPTLCDPMNRSTSGLPVHHELPESTQTHVHWVVDAIQPSHPLSSTSPPSFNLSQHQGLSNESALCIRWPKYWSFSFNISPSNEHSGWISFRMDWLDLLAVQGTLKSLLQHHSSKASILWRSAFLTVQLSHPYMTTGKTIALTRQTFADKVMSLLVNMLSRLVITFLPRSTFPFIYIFFNLFQQCLGLFTIQFFCHGLIPKYFILSDAIVHGIIFISLSSDCLLFVYRNTMDFCRSILYPATLLITSDKQMIPPL